jgi:hypothetical protein
MWSMTVEPAVSMELVAIEKTIVNSSWILVTSRPAVGPTQSSNSNTYWDSFPGGKAAGA